LKIFCLCYKSVVLAVCSIVFLFSASLGIPRSAIVTLESQSNIGKILSKL
jgi:hypothetical protein